MTLRWNIVGVVLLAVAAVRASSPALAGFGVDSLIEIVASTVVVVLVDGSRPGHSALGIVWTAATLAVVLALAAGNARTGAALDNGVLRTEGRVTLVDACIAGSVLLGLVLNAWLGWWWADPLAGLVIVYHAAREARHALRHDVGPAGAR